MGLLSTIGKIAGTVIGTAVGGPVGGFIGGSIGGAGGGALDGGGGGDISNAQGSAAQLQYKASQEANALQKYMYDQTRSDQMPWRNIGVNALGSLSQGFGYGSPTQSPAGYGGTVGATAAGDGKDWMAYLQANPDALANFKELQASGRTDALATDPIAFAQFHWASDGGTRAVPMLQSAQPAGQQPGTQPGTQTGSQVPDFLHRFSEEDFRADPGYQFRLSEGLKATQGSAAAGGALHSGGTLKALNRFAQGTADQTYNDAYNRYNNDVSGIYNRLTNLAGMGQTANGQIGQAGQNYANQAGNNLMNGANAQANGLLSSAATRAYYGQQQGQQLGSLANSIMGQVGPWSQQGTLGGGGMGGNLLNNYGNYGDLNFGSGAGTFSTDSFGKLPSFGVSF